MSVTMAKADGVTVFTLTSDPDSPCPPLCQILKGLCYSPRLCTVSQRLRKIKTTSQSILGALHIMVGLFNIGLGVILSCSRNFYDYIFTFWLGALFIFFGAMNILSEKCPSPCLVIFSVILNITGVGFAIAGIVLSSISMGNLWLGWMCNDYYSDYRYTPSPREDIWKEKCLHGQAIVLMLLRSIIGVLIVLSVLEFCVAISSVVLGIKNFKKSLKREDESTEDPEYCEPLLKEANGD